MKNIVINDIRTENNAVIVELNIDGSIEKIITTFSNNVVKYIVDDRIDAVVMGLMLFAIKHGYDFKSNLPISEGLYYNLRYYFIGAIASPHKMYHPQINAPLIADINDEGNIVATGISCGVDSLYTVYLHTQFVPAQYKLNHLVFLNVGSHNTAKGKQDSQRLFDGRKKLCQEFAKNAKLPLIESESNLPEIFDRYDDSGYSHVEEHTYMALFCMLWLQHGLKLYYYSSGIPYYDFDCKFSINSQFDAAQYDLLTLQCASFGKTKFLSSGGNIGRLEKLKTICDYKLAYKYLNVCVKDVCNCGKCFKCVRTLLELDAIGKIDLFKEVFNIEEYYRNRQNYLEQFYIGYIQKNKLLLDLYPYFRKELTTTLKIKAIYNKLLQIIKNRIH